MIYLEHITFECSDYLALHPGSFDPILSSFSFEALTILLSNLGKSAPGTQGSAGLVWRRVYTIWTPSMQETDTFCMENSGTAQPVNDGHKWNSPPLALADHSFHGYAEVSSVAVRPLQSNRVSVRGSCRKGFVTDNLWAHPRHPGIFTWENTPAPGPGLCSR